MCMKSMRRACRPYVGNLSINHNGLDGPYILLDRGGLEVVDEDTGADRTEVGPNGPGP